MESTLICFSTVRELEKSTRGIGSGESVLFKFVGSCTLSEAATIYRRLEGKVASGKGLWKVHGASMKILGPSARHYEDLDLLELSLDLMDLDLQDSVSMKTVRFDGVRITTNKVVTTADASNVFGLLDDVVIESQRMARVCRGLAFGREEVEVAALTQEDLDWLMADGAGALVLAGDGGEVLADGNRGEVPEDGYGGGGGKVLAGLVDGDEMLEGGGEKVLPVLVDGAEVLAGGGEKVLPVLVDGAEVLAGGGEKVLPVLVDGAEVLAGGGEKVLPVLVDGAEALAGGGEGVDVTEALGGSVEGVDVAEALAGTVDVGKPLAGSVVGTEALGGSGDSGNVLADHSLLQDLDVKEDLGGDHAACDGSGPQGEWIQVKEKTVVALIRLKICKLKEAIVGAKGRVINA